MLIDSIWIFYISATLLAIVLAMAIWRLPSWYDHSRRKCEMYADACDIFYDEATRLINDSRTPFAVVSLLKSINEDLLNRSVMRRIVWSAIKGELREHANHPTDVRRRFLRAVHDMPTELRDRYGKAVGFAMAAIALNSGLAGEIFLRFMLTDPKSQRETATALSAELARGPELALVA